MEYPEHEEMLQLGNMLEINKSRDVEGVSTLYSTIFKNMESNNRAQACTSLTEKLASHKMIKSECSIYRVHNHLRNINNKAYEPEIISIGPYHRHEHKFKMMEEHKLHYMHSLLERNNDNIDKYINAIAPLEQEARKCYVEDINLDKHQFTEMMVLDGCFIIDLVRKCTAYLDLRKKDDPIFRMDWIMNSLTRDLMLFENQIPFFVLSKLFDLIEGPQEENTLINRFLSFFRDLYPAERGFMEGEIENAHGIKHLLDLIHRSWRPSVDTINCDNDTKGDIKNLLLIKSVTELRNANVKFGKNNGNHSLFKVMFKSGTLILPPLIIDDKTESTFRNLIAYEQYFPEAKFNFVTDYVTFMDCLVNSSEDVEILSRFGIFENWLGDGEVVADMFNKLGDSIVVNSEFIYAQLFQSVNVHCDKRRNRWMAKLRRNYLHSPWAILSIVAAIVLLLLTVTQTVFSILQAV